MLNRLRDQIGTAGLVVAIVALVAALGGGAYAASKGLNPTQKKEVKKIAKSFQGTGPVGAAGPAGPAGPQGPVGPKGTDGAAGTDGANGVSATTTTFSGSKGTCTAGGVTIKSASPEVNVCNGKNGQTGFTETLPSKMTETGGWVISGATSAFLGDTVVSFPIPLAAEIPAENVHFGSLTFTKDFEGAEAEDCPGTEADPKAKPGHLCMYVSYKEDLVEAPQIFKLDGGGNGGASTVGAWLTVVAYPTSRVLGTWAVTAP